MLFIKCANCSQRWHVKCVGLEGITENPLKKLTTWNCPFCYVLPLAVRNTNVENGQIDTTVVISQIKKEMCEMENRLNEKISKHTNPEYAAIVGKVNDLNQNQKQGNQLMKTMLSRNKMEEDPEKMEKEERTCIILKPKDPNLRDSRDIKAAFSAKYPLVHIPKARNTVGGSILLEFGDAASAKKIMNQWDKTLFGGNEGIRGYKVKHTAGIIKQVEDLPENEIQDAIKQDFPEAHLEFFRKNGRVTGTVKILFDKEEALNQAIQEKIKINQQIYAVEVFKPKPRVIKCNTCQMFGHVSRLCGNKAKPVCGKCSGKDHETKDCEVQPADYKCAHCEGNHITGSYVCERMKEKMDQIQKRGNGLQ